MRRGSLSLVGVWAVAVGMAFLLGGFAAQAAPGDVVVKPDWTRKPPAEDIGPVYPEAARRAGVIGKARVECKVAVSGRLEQCETLSESPTGWGFGVAALAMTKYFTWRPETVNGVPVGDVPVVIPFDFGADSGEYGAVVIAALDRDARFPRLFDPIWSRAPTRAQVESAFPLRALGKIDSGYAILRCRVALTGLLINCNDLAESPPGVGFGAAALTLADRFVLSMADYKPAELKGVSVDIPVSFLAPGRPAPKLFAPEWVSTLDEADLAAVFPAKARATGVSRGGGVVKCRVTHEGRLVDCQLISETPDGLGFGEAVLKATNFIAMNPWSMDGAPVDDAIIQVPVTLALPALSPAPAKR